MRKEFDALKTNNKAARLKSVNQLASGESVNEDDGLCEALGMLISLIRIGKVENRALYDSQFSECIAWSVAPTETMSSTSYLLNHFTECSSLAEHYTLRAY